MSKKIIQDIYYLQMPNFFFGSGWEGGKVATYNCSVEVLLHFLKDHQVRIEMEK